MSESRLQRWSRQKAEARKEAELAPPSPAESEPSPEAQELVINETLPEHEILEKYNLPAPDTIVLGTDITGFMRKEIPEFLRRKALRALWKSNPVLAVLDGLNDYDEDFSDAATAGNVVQTLYKVGQGLIDKTARVDEQVEIPVKEQANASETISSAEDAEEIVDHSESEMRAEPLTASRHSEPVAPEPELETTPRYRPRMRFDH
ncbi:DUF3306 domain-containing protein [Marinobacter sp. M216]|uniref:DUF3306 domain-containing protein n=1 Tax=Marinobacter albus TaxID=3030833 RepID=A0ABT7H8J6_9GAMM|nr:MULTISPECIES: DUF3306 domain-containing protein [unclassified Marinobacter]MBW7471502.1 DUF3306 domain-containing protein [Marinobacter sp. F4218]MDK9556220.1 DUF3306 domain-containing protein [Marinobacter sp. M216]